jgi:hypothetical protein
MIHTTDCGHVIPSDIVFLFAAQCKDWKRVKLYRCTVLSCAQEKPSAKPTALLHCQLIHIVVLRVEVVKLALSVIDHHAVDDSTRSVQAVKRRWQSMLLYGTAEQA